MTPQEENDEALRRATEEQRILTEANKAAAVATDKAREANVKIEHATTAVMVQFQKLLDAQLKYTLAMAKGQRGSAQFNDSVDLMTDSMQMAATALSLLIPGGILIKGVTAGLTFLATNAMKSAGALQKAANEQADSLNKAYKTMSKSGLTASDGMTGLSKDVNRMRLNVNQFDAVISAMTANAKELGAMGGTVAKGREQFANLVEGMGDYEKALLNLGYSQEEQADYILGFMKLQANLSQGQQRDYSQLTGAAKKYIQETEALARVTGMNRQQQEAAQEKYMAQQRFGAKIQALRDEGTVESKRAADLLISGMKKAASQGEEFAQAYADSATGMLTTDAAIKGNMSTQGKMLEGINDILEGRITNETQAAESFQDTLTTVKDVHKSANALFQAGVGEDMFLPFKEGAQITKTANQNFAEQIDAAGREVQKLVGTVDGIDSQLKRYTDMEVAQRERMTKTQKDLDGRFMTTGVNAGTFSERLGKAALDIMDWLGSSQKEKYADYQKQQEQIQQQQKEAAQKWADSMDRYASGLNDMKESAHEFATNTVDSALTLGKNLLASVDAITGPLAPVFDKVKQGMSDLWQEFKPGLLEISNKMGVWATDTWESVKQSAAKFGSEMLASVEKITGPLGPVFDKVKTVFTGIADEVKAGIGRFSDTLVSMVNDLWKRLVSMFPGLGKAAEAATAAVETARSYGQKGAETVANAAGAVSDFVKGTFGGGATPKGATATATAGAPPTQTAAASAAPTGGSAPAQTTAPAPAARDGSGVERTANNVPAPAGNNKGGGGAIDDAATKAMIVKHEGIREKPYKDSLGLWTVGIGHLIGDGKKLPDDWNRKFSMDEIMTLFDKDYETHKAAAASIIPNFDKMTGSMKSAFIDLTYNMGPNWISKWPNLKKQLGTFDIAAAVDNLTNSKWATQVGNRAGDIIGMLKSGLPAEKGGVFDGPKSGYPMTLHGPEAVIPLKDGAVPVSMSQEFNMTATNLGELVSEMRNNMAMQDRMISVLEEIRRAQTTVADNTGRMVSYANN